MKRLAVFTSGSDAPGMNACIRSVIRSAHYFGLETLGIHKGYEGMIKGDFIEMDNRSVSNIIQKGGTILKCTGSDLFKTQEGRMQAYQNLSKHEVDGLIAIGGQGTFIGAELLHKEFGLPCIGIPGTIDNDLYGTDFTVGYDTAVNTALNAIDRLRDTAESHERVFFIEVMGKDTGYIALRSAISGGAEMAIMPERKPSIDHLIRKLEIATKNTQASHIVIVAEENGVGNTSFIAGQVKNALPGIDTKVTILGYIQRGGEPSAADRVLASQLGLGAVEGLLKGKTNVMAGVVNGSICYTSFPEITGKKKPVSEDMLRALEILCG